MKTQITDKGSFLNNVDYRIIFTIPAIITILILYVKFQFPALFSIDPQNSQDVLIAIAQILATILAITTSFTILGLQYVSQGLSPRVMKYIVYSKEIFLFFTIYLISIISSVFIASFPTIIRPGDFIYISIILLVWCLFSLIVSLISIVENMQIPKIVNIIIKKVPDNYDEILLQNLQSTSTPALDIQDPFIDIEQIIIRSIRNNDIQSFRSGLSNITSSYIIYLKKILENSRNSDFQENQRKANALHSFFFRIYKRIFFEIIQQNNEALLIDYLSDLLKIFIQMLENKSEFSVIEIKNLFEEIWFLILERKFQGASFSYMDTLSKVLKTEFSSLPSGDYLLSYWKKIPITGTITERDSHFLYFGERTLDWLISDLDFLVKLSSAVKDERFHYVFHASNSIISEMITRTIKRTDNEKFRRDFTSRLLNNSIKIYKLALEKGSSVHSFPVGFISQFYRNPQEYDILPLKDLFITYFKIIGAISIKYKITSGIHDIGFASGMLFEHFPEISNELVDILIEISKKERLNEKDGRIIVTEIRQQLNFIKQQNKLRIKEIDEKIDSEIDFIEGKK